MDQDFLNIQVRNGSLRPIVYEKDTINRATTISDYILSIRDDVVIGNRTSEGPKAQYNISYAGTISGAMKRVVPKMEGEKFLETDALSYAFEGSGENQKADENRIISPPPTINKILIPNADLRLSLLFDDIIPRIGISRFLTNPGDGKFTIEDLDINLKNDLTLSNMPLAMIDLENNLDTRITNSPIWMDIHGDTNRSGYEWNEDDITFVKTNLGFIRYGGETIDSRLINKSWMKNDFVKIPILIEYQLNGEHIEYGVNDEKYRDSSSSAIIKKKTFDKAIKVFNYTDGVAKRDDNEGARVSNDGKILLKKEYNDFAVNDPNVNKESFNYITRTDYIKELWKKFEHLNTSLKVENSEYGCGYITGGPATIPLQFNPEIVGESRSANWNGISTLGKNGETMYWSNTNAKTIQFKTTYVIMAPTINDNGSDYDGWEYKKSPPWTKDVYNVKHEDGQADLWAYNKLYEQWGKTWTEPFILNILKNYERLMYGDAKKKDGKWSYENGNRISPAFIRLHFAPYFQHAYNSPTSITEATWIVSDCSIDARQELGYTASRNNMIYDVTLTLKEQLNSDGFDNYLGNSKFSTLR
jgi:hypothetical protein